MRPCYLGKSSFKKGIFWIRVSYWNDFLTVELPTVTRTKLIITILNARIVSQPFSKLPSLFSFDSFFIILKDPVSNNNNKPRVNNSIRKHGVVIIWSLYCHWRVLCLFVKGQNSKRLFSLFLFKRMLFKTGQQRGPDPWEI